MEKMTMEIFSKLEQQWLNMNAAASGHTKKAKILSIDGGGTTPTIVGAFLIHLEETIQAKTGDATARIADFFDIIAGTGIGGVLAVFLTAADSAGRPLFCAKEAVSFLARNHPRIFKPKRSGILRKKSTVKCCNASMSAIFKESLSSMTLKDTCKPILVPCYDLATSAPFVFSRAAAAASGWAGLDFELWKVCVAATATPSMFDPVEVSSIDGKTTCVAVDGGVVMNNPTAAAVTHVLHNKVDFPAVNSVEDLLVMSLGNGTLNCRSGNSGNWGAGSKKSVATCVVDIAVDGVSETVDQMLGNSFSWNRNDYVRIQANGFGGSGLTTMEGVLKEKGIESLTFGSKRLLAEANGERIEGFVQRLVAASGKSSLPPSPYKSLSPLLDGR